MFKKDRDYYVMTWCDICYDWKLHKPSKDLDDKTISCIDCRTIYEGYVLEEIPKEKIEEQRKRYLDDKHSNLADLYYNILTNCFNGINGIDDIRIIHDDAGYKAHKEKEKLNKIEEMKMITSYFFKVPKNIQRNDLCHCGSNIKYKKCCREKDIDIKRKIMKNYRFCKENNIIK